MSFLFGKKEKKGLTREAGASGPQPPVFRDKEKLGPTAPPQQTPGSSVNNSLNSLGDNQGRNRPEQVSRSSCHDDCQHPSELNELTFTPRPVWSETWHFVRSKHPKCQPLPLVAAPFNFCPWSIEPVSQIWYCSQCGCIERRRYICYGRFGQWTNG